MTTYFADGDVDRVFSAAELRTALHESLKQLGERQRVLAIPPDFTRFDSGAGPLTCDAFDYYGDRMVDVMPALGTHVPMSAQQLRTMFPVIPPDRIRVHRWREDVVTVGEVPADFVASVTEGVYRKPWPAQLNRLVWEGKHDLILSFGQVVPHEVIGMASYNKNLFVGTGGSQGINASHFLSAAYGMERVMGQADTPLRRILNYAEQTICPHLPTVYVLTVVGLTSHGRLATRGLFIGSDVDCFLQASDLAKRVNFEVLDEAPKKIVVSLDEAEFHSTWLGNKSIYRTRMAIADNGELIVLAPGVRTFGEDPEIDRLIRQYGYRTTPEIMRFVNEHDNLAQNLSAAAHLIHGSSENRFRITYCPGHMSREEIEGVGYQYGDLAQMIERFPTDKLRPGWNETTAEGRFFYVPKPAMGLWASRDRL